MNHSLVHASEPFLNYLVEWKNKLPTLGLATPAPAGIAVVSVDMVNGFCTTGPLASPRVQAIAAPIAELFVRAHTAGVQHFVLLQDTHAPDAVQFNSYAPHCVRGTPQAQTVPELAGLPFSNRFVVIEKNTINPLAGTRLEEWLEGHPQVTTFVVVGNCTDLCVYQAAMELRLRANARQDTRTRVIVPADCVATYDLPVEAAAALNVLPHDGDLLHLIFLYHMALNGIEVIAHVE